ncbi:helix-turn-helix domain-containing protein [Acetobacterium woodii]|uniref:Transcriptional regulator n=1 Tax=Acetobacterium woodii (strain ATCC 29683 / DSM 1030 / JCM 2381 / KCTC 1655 / WB1) TaxID=931626 RepID=H6LHY8_ACEWD|nr:helix-turn-helix transcriptional regulator [Acetobacterium woodii]AFA48518.1 transcriptional regulator [Acetobacterium woodii DSM 1030]
MIGERLQELRKSVNLTQEELSHKLSISRSSLSLYEIDKREPDCETSSKIADFFDVSLDYLYGRSNDKSHTKATVLNISATLTENEKKVLKIFSRIKDEALQEKIIIKIEGYVDCMVEMIGGEETG